MSWSGHDALLQRWLPQFRDRQLCTDEVREYLKTARVLDDHRADEWMHRGCQRDQALAAITDPTDPLGESHPQQPFELDAASLEKAIASGDLHDFRNPLLSAEQHAALCPRCQAGIRSRQRADDRGAAVGKAPLPGLGTALQQFQDHTRRCDDCGVMEDQPAPDACPRSFWHLPDIWLTLHPDATLTDMGTLGPFMRGFLRRQRPRP